MRALLEVLEEPHGLVLVLDDVHWADGGSCELQGHYLLGNPVHAPGVGRWGTVRA